MKKIDIRTRREALGLSQKQMADMVAKRAGQEFSQQSFSKLEKGLETNSKTSSRMMHFILEILEERELGDRAIIKRQVDQLPDVKLKVLRAYLDGLTHEEP